MIRKCANPACDVAFRSSHEGRLFPFEIRNATGPCHDVPPVICEKQPGRATVCFWLCERCCDRFILRFSVSSGVMLTPAFAGRAAQRRKKGRTSQTSEPESYGRRYA